MLVCRSISHNEPKAWYTTSTISKYHLVHGRIWYR